MRCVAFDNDQLGFWASATSRTTQDEVLEHATAIRAESAPQAHRTQTLRDAPLLHAHTCAEGDGRGVWAAV